MAIINVLDPHVADLIAAGEVVERPASVIKELLENAFDAGAHSVTCEIRNGGTTYIRVTDDGCGMAPEDAGVAFLRHATSKLHDAAGLEGISTMGFRGEALAAISSVSRIELLTKQHGTAEGTKVTLEAGDIQDMTPCGCPDGTSMIVRDLFYNTPARLKFMKTDRSEASACVTAALRCALARPDVSVRLIRDGEDEFFSPGDGRIDSCLYTLLGREEAAGMLQCSSSNASLALDGYISSPSQGRGNRAHQFFFVNGRFIKSVLLQTAVEQAYKNTLLTGRYPGCVLYLTMAPGSVDVNVHPAKTEVRFTAEKTVFDFVYQAVKFALESENTLASPSLHSAPAEGRRADEKQLIPPVAEAGSATTKKTGSGSYPGSGISGRSAVEASSYGATAPHAASGFYQAMRSDEFRSRATTDRSGETVLKTPSVSYKTTPAVSPTENEKNAQLSLNLVQAAQTSCKPAEIKASDPVKKIFVENSVQNVENSPTLYYKILGEAFKTYIIVEQNAEIILIDKHAAHERMIFDRLKERAKGSTIDSQLLLAPAVIRLSGEDAELLDKNSQLLSDLGFEIDAYGEKEYIVRGVPSDMNTADVQGAIEEICEKLRTGNTPDPSSVRDDVLHTVACKAAIKAGWDTHRAELEKLVEAVLSGEIRYCPHGRPVSAVVTRRDLDKLFKRIV